MKTVYIPKGETVCYESLETEHLIVKGCVKAARGLTARTISGDGVVIAQTVHADDIRVREVEACSVICKRFLANQAQITELIASESAAVSVYLSASYVKTGKLTVSVSEVDAVDAAEVVNLGAKRRSLFGLLLLSALRPLWARLTVSPVRAESKESVRTEDRDDDDRSGGSGDSDADLREEIAKTVREILAEQSARAATVEESEEDRELKRMQGVYRLLRDQGYTLQIIPGTPEEAAPVLSFGAENTMPDAA